MLDIGQSTRRLTISDLPNEIVAQIFSSGSATWRDSRPLDLPFPVLVSAICFHWRQVARETPDLWAFIVPPLHKDDEDCLQWTKEWLEKSAVLPISIVVDDRLARSKRSAKATKDLISETLELIIQSAYRLLRLDISAANLGILESSAHGLVSAPFLQQVSLSFWQTPLGASFSTTSHRSLCWLVTLPRLLKLKIQGVASPNPGNLTSFTAHKLRIGYKDTCRLFSSSPSLTHLVLRDLVPMKSPFPVDPKPIQANSLHSLAIHSHGIDERSAIYFLNFLSIPNLWYLEVDGDTRVTSILGKSLDSARNIHKLRISNCTKFFFLSHPTESKRDIYSYHSLSSIRHLELVHVPTRGLLSKIEDTRLLSPGSHKNGIPWPELCTITLDTGFAVDVVRLVEFIQLHGNMQSVELSNSAARHVPDNIMRRGDTVVLITPQILAHENENEDNDASKFLTGLVEVKLLRSYRYGLVDGDRIS